MRELFKEINHLKRYEEVVLGKVNEALVGRECTIGFGKYKGRSAKIDRCFFQHQFDKPESRILVMISIKRKDGKGYLDLSGYNNHHERYIKLKHLDVDFSD